MPCDGIAVATLDVALAEELLAAQEAVPAVVGLLSARYDVSISTDKTLIVNGHRLRIETAGRIVGYQVPQNIMNAVRDACMAVAGVLMQQRLAAQIADTCQVFEQCYAGNGYLVLKVNL